MKIFNVTNAIIILLLIALFSCKKSSKNNSRVEILPYYKDASFTPYWFSPGDKALDSFHRIPSFTLINQNGEIVTQNNFIGKIYVADFFFTTCAGICPKMTNNMMEIQNEFLNDDDILLLSHSVTPRQDSVSVLKRYAENKGILSNKWHLVTGSQKDIYRLGRKAYFIEEDLGLDKEEDEFLHTENFVIIDRNSHIRGIYNGLNKASIKQLVIDIKTLKME